MATTPTSHTDSSSDAPTTSFSLPGADPEHCPRCGAQMSADQRYCVECGTRRGKPRFALSGSGESAPPPSNPTPPTRTTSNWSSGIGLLLTIGVILLTLGVGYMIGNHGGSNGSAAPSVKVYGDGGGGGSGTPTTSSNTNSGSSGSSNSHKSSKSSSVSNTKKQKAPASSNAGEGANPGAQALVTDKKAAPKSKKKRAANVNKALNSGSVNKNGKTVPSPTTKIGSKCSPGTEGCSASGKETGPDL